MPTVSDEAVTGVNPSLAAEVKAAWLEDAPVEDGAPDACAAPACVAPEVRFVAEACAVDALAARAFAVGRVVAPAPAAAYASAKVPWAEARWGAGADFALAGPAGAVSSTMAGVTAGAAAGLHVAGCSTGWNWLVSCWIWLIRPRTRPRESNIVLLGSPLTAFASVLRRLPSPRAPTAPAGRFSERLRPRWIGGDPETAAALVPGVGTGGPPRSGRPAARR